MENPLKDIFEAQEKLMKRKAEQSRNALKHSRFSERMSRVYENSEEFKKLPFYLRDEETSCVNCVGLLGFVIDEEPLMVNIASGVGESKKVRLSLFGNRPGYIPPEVMKRFLETRCTPVGREDICLDDLIVFKDSAGFFEHVGIYLCTVEASPVSCQMMFHQWNYGGPIGFDDILDFYENEDADDIEAYRLKMETKGF